MAVNVETLEKLERKVTLTLPINAIETVVDTRLKRLARQVKIDGFRPGKVPAKVVAQMYGASVQYEVMNDKVGEVFASAANEAQLRVAGSPRISEVEGAPAGEMRFDAVFEVYPDVQLGDLSATEVIRLSADVTDEATVLALVDRAEAELGPVDLFISNAGISPKPICATRPKA